MFSDPIVQEVRTAGEELADVANGDVKQFFANLRMAQEEYTDRLVHAVPKEEPYDSSAVNERNVSEGRMNDPA
jgi:hypothetical protein